MSNFHKLSFINVTHIVKLSTIYELGDEVTSPWFSELTGLVRAGERVTIQLLSDRNVLKHTVVPSVIPNEKMEKNISGMFFRLYSIQCCSTIRFLLCMLL